VSLVPKSKTGRVDRAIAMLGVELKVDVASREEISKFEFKLGFVFREASPPRE
jgi:hypothetical protein